jgi:hypothetical protein
VGWGVSVFLAAKASPAHPLTQTAMVNNRALSCPLHQYTALRFGRDSQLTIYSPDPARFQTFDTVKANDGVRI